MRTAFIYNNIWTQGLHIGAARAALMNWFLAKKKKENGKLCVFCNDFERSGKDSVPDLLNWLGIANYEGPYYFRHFADVYERIVQHLLDCGFAYWDYATVEEMAAERRKAIKGNSSLYSRKFAAFSQAERQNFEGRDYVVRLRMPRSYNGHFEQESIVIEDHVMGRKKFDLAQEHDHVIYHSNGRYSPILTSVVTYDHWRIDIVIADMWHWKTMPAQRFIASRANLKQPRFAHIPLLFEPNINRRFSAKRCEQQMKNIDFADFYNRAKSIYDELDIVDDSSVFHPAYVDFYRRIGFLPAALRHYLLASGSISYSPLRTATWAFDDNEIDLYFDLSKIGSEPDRYSVRRLMELQKRYMQRSSIDSRAWLVNNYLRNIRLSGFCSTNYPNKKPPRILRNLVSRLEDRLILAGDIVSLTDFFDANLRYRENSTNVDMSFDANMASSDFVYEGCPNL